jgi:hypothetical protein
LAAAPTRPASTKANASAERRNRRFATNAASSPPTSSHIPSKCRHQFQSPVRPLIHSGS